MRRLAVFILLAAVVFLAAVGTPTRAQGLPPDTVVNYTPTDAVFPNPERGFLYAEETHSWNYTLLDETTLQSYRQNEDITLIKRYFYLDDFVPNYYKLPAWPWPPDYDFLTENPNYPVYDGANANTVNIPGDYLVKMQEDFDRLRGAGLKAVVRFAYTNRRFVPPFEDADLQAVLDHLDQLQPILRLNTDVIALVEAGFIGNWGEWFYTDHFIEDPLNLQASPFEPEYITANDYANRGLVLSEILEVLPDHLVQLRTPHYKYQIYDEPSPYSAPRPLPTPLSAANAHDGSNIARTGHHNDCFLGNDTDAGTYGSWLTISDDKDYLAAETNYVPMGGEVCNPGGGGPTRFDCFSALAELERFHWSYLNVETGAGGLEVYNGWDTGGCLEEIKRRLGYRLELVQGTYASQVERGDDVAVHVELKNVGWAAPFNPRPVELLLRHTTSGTIHRSSLPDDPRFWLADEAATYSLDYAIPTAGIPPGEYELLLNLPAPEPALYGRPEYSIRLANNNVWEASSGYNSLLHTVTVTGPVGGIAELPEVAGAPLHGEGQSGNATGLMAGIATAITAGAVALVLATWYAARREDG